MASPLTVARNDYHNNPKQSTIYTPVGVAKFLFDLLWAGRCTVLDPAIGSGRLTDPWRAAGCRVLGVDIEPAKPKCDVLLAQRFETVEAMEQPDLVLCNPPFNGCAGRQLYPEVFLRHILKLFGPMPTVLFTPMGFRLNQRRKSERWKWCRDGLVDITSIISLPLDLFPGVEFHAEILIFNRPGLKSHYFLSDNALNE
jgi:hypothetical protein